MAIENRGFLRLVKPHSDLATEPALISFQPGTVGAPFTQRTAQLPDAHVKAIRAHLDVVLRSKHFDGSARSREFLRYVVEEVLAGRGAYLKQAAIAVEVFGRKPDFDAVIDPIVRVQAGRLRRSLERYYLIAGDSHSLRIELPKGSYAPVFTEAPEETSRFHALPETPNEWPSVVMHRLACASAGLEAAAAQLCDEIAAELCRHGIVRVTRLRGLDHGGLAAHPATRFELHGVVFEDDNGPWVAMRLEDRASGQQIWADEFHASPRPAQAPISTTDMARQIAARIGADHGIIARQLSGEHAARGFDSADPFCAIARSLHFLFSRHTGNLLPIIDAMQEMTRRAPEAELGWTLLARLCLMNHTFELTDRITTIESVIDCANQSVLLEPASARTRSLMATALLVKGELTLARRELELAARHNSDALAHREVIGWLTALAGDWDQGLHLMRTAMERNPYCHPCVNHGIWADAMRRRDFDAAYTAALEYRDRSFFWRELMITSCLGQLGRVDEARATAVELLRCKPTFSSRGLRLISHYIKSDDIRAVIVEGLGRAGVQVS